MKKLSKLTLTHDAHKGILDEEKPLFIHELKHKGLPKNIWDILNTSLKSSTAFVKFQLFRLKKANDLMVCFYAIRCVRYGSSLTRSKFLQKLLNLLPLPLTLWLRSSSAAEVVSNPGFIRESSTPLNWSSVLSDLRKKIFLFCVLDEETNKDQYDGFYPIPFAPNGSINCTLFENQNDYLNQFKRMKPKLRYFGNKGGVIEQIVGQPKQRFLQEMKHCIHSTGKRAPFQLPFQKNYANLCVDHYVLDQPEVITFVARNQDHFLGYHSFLMCGDELRCIHGAFNRELKTTYHAYENIICSVLEFALKNKMKRIHFGSVLNEAKLGMMTDIHTVKVYFSCSLPWLKPVLGKVFTALLKQNKSFTRFTEIKGPARLFHKTKQADGKDVALV